MADKSQDLTRDLFEKINKIRLNEAAGVFGTTSHQSILHDLQKAMATFHESLNASKDYDTIMKAYEALAASLDTAAITGIISEDEMTSYYELLDGIWIAIERERLT